MRVQMRSNLSGLVVLAAVLSLAGSALNAETIEYDVTVLPQVPGSFATLVRGMNNHGELVGYSQFNPDPYYLRGWKWSAADGLVMLPRDLQLAAVRALRRVDDGSVALLRALTRWPSWAAAVREVILSEFLPDGEFASGFLLRLKQGSITATSLSVGARKRLLGHEDIAIRGRANELFTAAERDRMKVLETYRPALELRGDPGRGRGVFRELCAPCHRLEREGIHLGPDLFGVRNQSKETLLLHIIVPNREIPSGFEATVVTTKGGKTLIGSITSETRASITIRQKGGLEQTLLHDDVLSTTVSPISLMPEGIEASTTMQGMADLLAYLRGEG